MNKSTPIDTNVYSMKRYWNKLIYSNIALTYGILMLILALVPTAGNLAFTKGQIIGNAIMSGIIIVSSLVFCLFINYKIYQKNIWVDKEKVQMAIMVMSLFVPLTFIWTMIWKKKLSNKYNREIASTPGSKKIQNSVPHVIVLLFYITLATILVIWLVYFINGPIGDNVAPGILDVFIAPLYGFQAAADLIVFLLCIGAFLAIVDKTHALEAGVGYLTSKMKGKESILIPIMMTLFALGGTTFGMCEETLPFFLIVIPIMIAAGFDAIVGLMTVMFGAGVGVMGSIINPFLIVTAIDSSNSGYPPGSEIVTIADGMVWRLVGWIILLAITIAFVMLYANKVKKDKTKSIVFSQYEMYKKEFKFDQNNVVELTTKRKWTLLIFAASFLLMIFMVISWSQIIPGFTAFDDFNSWLSFNFPFISSAGAVGTWYLIEMSFIFIVSGFIIALIDWSDHKNYISDIMFGIKDFVGVAVVISVARGLALILSNSGINDLIVDGLSSMFGGMSEQAIIIFLLFMFIGLSLFISSTSGFATAVFPSIAPALVQTTASVSGAITTFSYASGLVNLISPSAALFAPSLAVSKVSLIDFYKATYKMWLALFATAIILLMIGTLLPGNVF